MRYPSESVVSRESPLRRAMRRHAGRFVDDTFPPRRPVDQAVTRSPLLSRLEIWRYAGGLRSVKERCVLRGAGRRFHWVTPLPSLVPYGVVGSPRPRLRGACPVVFPRG